ncbi:MAG: hypothetical protein K5769_02795 [Pseudobutyrivibrio sp.]|nr:hypothetical protein [Pseudobutyrivibrio sp.]
MGKNKDNIKRENSPEILLNQMMENNQTILSQNGELERALSDQTAISERMRASGLSKQELEQLQIDLEINTALIDILIEEQKKKTKKIAKLSKEFQHFFEEPTDTSA